MSKCVGYAGAKDAAKAADLATLALNRRGPLNFLKNIYLQRDVEKEKERLRNLGLLAREPSKRKAAHSEVAGQQKHTPHLISSKQQPQQELLTAQQDQTLWPAAEAADQHVEHAAGGSMASRKRKRKAASHSTDTTAAAAASEREQQHLHAAPAAAAAAAEGRPKRRRVQQAVQGSPVAEAVRLLPPRKPCIRQHCPVDGLQLAGATARVSAALVPAAPRADVLVTAAAEQLAPPGNDNQEALLQQLRSALAAHELSKQQLRAALNALEVSEGQLAAVARATGLQL
jgi:hypothetical protein